MTVVRTARGAAHLARGTAGRVALSLVVAVLVTVTVQSAITSVLAERSMVAEAVARVSGDARAVQVQRDEPDLAEAVADLAQRPDVVAVQVVLEDGTVLAEAGDVAETGDVGVAADAGSALRTGTVATRPVGGHLLVTAPLRLRSAGDAPAALRMELDTAGMAGRAGIVQRRLVVVLVAGGIVTVLLWLAMGGARTVGRYASALVAAATDDLTGVGSRRAFRGDLERQAADAARRRTPLALALFDVNGTAVVRDTGGRRRADALLRTVAALLRQEHAGTYRVAGDGFAVIMPGQGVDRAGEVAEDLRRRIADAAAPLTADVGVAALDEVSPDAETLLIRAETDLADARERRGLAEALGGALDGAADDASGGHDHWDVRWLTGGG